MKKVTLCIAIAFSAMAVVMLLFCFYLSMSGYVGPRWGDISPDYFERSLVWAYLWGTFAAGAWFMWGNQE